MKVIDCRLRPPYRSFVDSFLYEPTTFNAKRERRALPLADKAIENHSMDEMIKEMDKANIVYGVCPVRTTDHGKNEDLYTLAKEYPNRFIGIPMVNPFGGEQSVKEIEKYIIEDHFKGITLETLDPATGKVHRPDDERIFDVYEKCEELEIPVIITSGGGMGKNLEYMPPIAFVHVANTFPKLKMVLAHGNWPFANEICGYAVGFPNMYIQADTFMMSFAPGSEIYAKAANYMLQDKFLFGSSYPSQPLDWSVDNYIKQLRPEVVNKVMYENAAKLFHLDGYDDSNRFQGATY